MNYCPLTFSGSEERNCLRILSCLSLFLSATPSLPRLLRRLLEMVTRLRRSGLTAMAAAAPISARPARGAMMAARGEREAPGRGDWSS